MRKHRFTISERYAIWETYNHQCFFCGEPLSFKDTTIDHLFPETLLEKPEELETIKAKYSLPSNFEINNFCNWVPTHQICNGKKSTSIIRDSPMFLLSVEKVQEKSLYVKKKYDNTNKFKKTDKIIARLLTDLANGNISNDDLLKLSESTSIFYFNKPDINVHELYYLPEGWKIMSINRETKSLRVTNGKIAGNIPIEHSPHPSWLCPTCFKYGPWEGSRCCNCGHYHYTD